MKVFRFPSLVLFLCVHCCFAVDKDNTHPLLEVGGVTEAIFVILEEEIPTANDVVFLQQYELLANSKVDIIVENNLPVQEKFFYYIQVHSYLREVVLVHDKDATNSTSDRGSNIGHIFFMNSTGPSNHTLALSNEDEKRNATIMIALLVYEVDKTPIPGACPSSSENPNTPTMAMNTLEDTISVTITPGTLPNETCPSSSNLKKTASYEFRFMYLGKNEFSSQIYFETLKGWLVASKAASVGEQFPDNKINDQQPNTRLFSRYAGMGLFVMVILRDPTNENYIPISYVSSASSGCLGSDQIDCDATDNTAILIIIMVIGTAIIILRRRFVWGRAMVYFLLIGGFLVFVVQSILPFGGVWNRTATIIVAVILGVALIMKRCCCAAGESTVIYYLADCMAGMILGYTLSCMILFGSADAEFLISSTNYFLLFFGVILLMTFSVFCLLPIIQMIKFNVIIGSTFIILPLLFLFDGTLQYAFVNNWRRVRDSSFRFALASPHLEVIDWFSTILWIAICSLSVYCQRKAICGRESFDEW